MNVLEMLRLPFEEKDLEWRVGNSGTKKDGSAWIKPLVYITNRALMERLDDSVGAENWRNEYKDAPCGGVLCGLSIRIKGEWVTKWDGAENTDVEAVKGGLSNAMKRAGVHWGIGRYLYGVGNVYATVVAAQTKFSISSKIKATGNYVSWMPPELPAEMLPSTKRINREELQSSLTAIVQGIAGDDRSSVDECYAELEEHEKFWVWKLMSTKQKDYIRNNNQEVAA